MNLNELWRLAWANMTEYSTGKWRPGRTSFMSAGDGGNIWFNMDMQTLWWTQGRERRIQLWWLLWLCVLYTPAVVVSQAGWLTLLSNHIIQSLNRHTIGQPGSHDNYDRTSALFLLPLCVSVCFNETEQPLVSAHSVWRSNKFWFKGEEALWFFNFRVWWKRLLWLGGALWSLCVAIVT